MFRIIRKFLVYLVDSILLVFVKTKNIILFIPHRGFYVNDYASTRNYRSDNTLTFLHYILENGLYSDYKLIVASTETNGRLIEEQDFISVNYPHRNILVFDFFDLGNGESILKKIRRKILILSSEVVISSEPHYISLRNRRQKIICASYYPAPFKNDFIPKESPYFMNYAYECSFFDYFISNSKLASHLDSSSTSISFDKYINIGQCRLDNFTDKCISICENFSTLVDYPIKRIVLYTPTHRDYETGIDVSRSILGFKYDKEKLENFLRSNNTIIICKLHPKQNRRVVDSELPYGIINFRGNQNYGLTELMICSDLLITDYTSGYYEYLLLDKPVLFNFYDYDEYESSRGFTIDPIRTLCAGDIIYNEDSFYQKLTTCLSNNGDNYKLKRNYIRDLLFTYQDGKACERLYEFINSVLCK